LLEQELWDVVKPKLLANKNADIKFINKLKLDLAEDVIVAKQNEIKEEYRIKRETACERGTAIHAKFENSFYNQKQFDFKNYGFEEISGDYTCNKDYYILDLDKGVYPEFLIACNSQDGFLRIAGQIDLLIVNGNDVYIVDFKSNKEIKKSSFYDKKKKSNVMMKFPINNLQDCNFNHYQLQLSTYAFMLQTLRPELNIKKLILYHIDHDGNEMLHECKYLKEEVIRMLNHYKKKLKIKKSLDRDKPVIIG
jgi:ATP-dependent exoDNAse (exonuclease V) beta subunit